MIGMVLDHGVEEDALVVDFFSHLVPTPKGGVYLGKKFNKKVLLISRLAGNSLNVILVLYK